MFKICGKRNGCSGTGRSYSLTHGPIKSIVAFILELV